MRYSNFHVETSELASFLQRLLELTLDEGAVWEAILGDGNSVLDG